MYSWDYTTNHNENENEKKITQIGLDLCLDMDTIIVNVKSASV